MQFAHSCFKSQPTQIAPDTPCQNTWEWSKGMVLTAAGGLWTPWEVLEVSGSSLITAHYSMEDVLSTVSFGALTGHLPKHLLTWARWAVMGVLCLILLLRSVGAKLLFCGAFQCFLQWFPCDFRPLWLGQFASTKTIFIVSVKSLDVLVCCTCYIHIFKHLVMP